MRMADRQIKIITCVQKRIYLNRQSDTFWGERHLLRSLPLWLVIYVCWQTQSGYQKPFRKESGFQPLIDIFKTHSKELKEQVKLENYLPSWSSCCCKMNFFTVVRAEGKIAAPSRQDGHEPRASLTLALLMMTFYCEN